MVMRCILEFSAKVLQIVYDFIIRFRDLLNIFSRNSDWRMEFFFFKPKDYGFKLFCSFFNHVLGNLVLNFV